MPSAASGVWSFAAALLCIAVVLSFAGEYVYGKVAAAPAPSKPFVAQDNLVRIPLTDLTDASLHFYSADVNGSVIRFIVIHKPNGDYATALDACQICGPSGYRQEGQSIICRTCGAAIYIPSIGESGGCNPIAREIPRRRRAQWSWIFPRLATRPPRFTPDAMLARLVRESFTRNPRRKILTAAALVVGMAVATATLTIALEVGDRLAHEFRSFGANLLVTPQSDTLPVEIGGVDYRPVNEGAYLQEADLGKLKTIFWRHNIEGFTPFLDVPAIVPRLAEQ